MIFAPAMRHFDAAAAASAGRRSRLRAATAAAGEDARARTRLSARQGPDEEGLKLADSGLFGNNDRRMSQIQRAKGVARLVLEREMGGACYGREKVEAQLAKHVSLIGGGEVGLTVAGAHTGVES
jgi:hypothetical protein